MNVMITSFYNLFSKASCNSETSFLLCMSYIIHHTHLKMFLPLTTANVNNIWPFRQVGFDVAFIELLSSKIYMKRLILTFPRGCNKGTVSHKEINF